MWIWCDESALEIDSRIRLICLGNCLLIFVWLLEMYTEEIGLSRKGGMVYLQQCYTNVSTMISTFVKWERSLFLFWDSDQKEPYLPPTSVSLFSRPPIKSHHIRSPTASIFLNPTKNIISFFFIVSFCFFRSDFLTTL